MIAEFVIAAPKLKEALDQKVVSPPQRVEKSDIQSSSIFEKSYQKQNDDIRYLVEKGGYSEEIATRIEYNYPKLIQTIKAGKARGKAIAAFRGFWGRFDRYNSRYQKKGDRGEVWFATQMADPTDYANAKGMDKYERDDYDGHSVITLGGYILEYEIPGNMTQRQNGEFDRPSEVHPK